MKFEKPLVGSGLSSDQLAAANRFDERRAKQETERRREYVDPSMRARVSALFAELYRSLAAKDLSRRAPRWKDMTPAQAADQLAALPDRFAEPVAVSTGLRGQFESADF